MPVKKRKPYTKSSRYWSVLDYSGLSKEGPKKQLLEKLNYTAGRNGTSGRIAVRRKGGRVKRLYRVIDFKRNKLGIPGLVTTVEYDPNRTVNIALVKYPDGEFRYILAPEGLVVGQEVVSGKGSPVKSGNAMPLKDVPPGTTIHNVELHVGRGGQIARTAGGAATVAGKDGEYVLVKLPSGELRKIHENCSATIGELGNKDHNLVSLGKAGRNRYKGKRPKVRGVVMNPVDHPHGGGEGKTSGGRHPVSPWGQPAKGYKTRKKNNRTDKFIVQRRVNKRLGR